MCNMRDPYTNVRMQRKLHVENELDRRDTAPMSLSFTSKLASTVDTNCIIS